MAAAGNPVMRQDSSDPAGAGGKAAAILAAARRAFLAAGFGAVSMDAIARQAAVSKATVYAHFASKEELFGAVIADMSERYFSGFSASELDPGDAAASLKTLAHRYLDLLLSPEAVAVNRVIIGEVVRFPALGEVFWRAGPVRIRAQLETFMRRAAAAGSLEIADPRLAAEHFASLVRGEIHLRHLMRLDPVDPAGARAAADGAVATFLAAFGRQPPAARPG
jgi:AcrR family transcriptional regulator